MDDRQEMALARLIAAADATTAWEAAGAPCASCGVPMVREDGPEGPDCLSTRKWFCRGCGKQMWPSGVLGEFLETAEVLAAIEG